ncbi:MAG: hypothetical protein EXS32_08260 [Opitutus sp.]|nr:hypothetical protein [Opitutus sp.]
MNPTLRNVLAVFAGTFAGLLLIGLMEVISAKIYPPPPGVDFTNREAVKAYVAGASTGMFLIVLLGYTLGPLIAAWLATGLAATNHRRRGLTVGALFLTASILNLREIPHPTWFWVANIVLVVMAAVIGTRAGASGILPASRS